MALAGAFTTVIGGKTWSVAGQARHGNGGAVRGDRATVGWLWRALAAVIVAGRYVILLA